MGRRRDWPLVAAIVVWLTFILGAVFAWHHRVEIATVLRAWGIG